MDSERSPGFRRAPPTIAHMLDVLSAAAVGDAQARVDVAPEQRSHPHELLGHAINVLLTDLSQDVADTRAVLAREEAGRARHDLADLIAAEVEAARGLLDGDSPAQLRAVLGSLATGLDELRELTEIELGRTLLREEPLQLRALLEDRLRRAGGDRATLSVGGEVPETLLGDPMRLALIVDRMLDALAPVRRLEASAIPASTGWQVVRIEATAEPAPAAPSGLRLAIAQGLAEALGGQLAVDAQAGSATLIAPLAGQSSES